MKLLTSSRETENNTQQQTNKQNTKTTTGQKKMNKQKITPWGGKAKD